MALTLRFAYLISDLVTPLYHLWYRLLVHLLARFADRVDNGKVALQRVERRNGVLRNG